jgi:integrase
MHCQEQAQSGEIQPLHPTANAAELFEFWLKNIAFNHVKPSTFENYYFCMQKYVLPFFKKAENSKLTEDSITRFVKSIRNHSSLAVSYQRKILTIFKTALKESVKTPSECAVTTKSIQLPRAENETVQAFSMKEQRLIESAVLHSGDWRALGILLCFYTGLRLGELCALKWGDLDFEAGTMSIQRTVSRIETFRQDVKKTVLFVGTPKSQKSIRKIPLPDFIVQKSAQFKKFAAEENDYVLSGTDVPFDPRTYQKLFKRILKAAKVKDRKFHAIRHTFATRSLELGVDIKTLSEILGHSNSSITLNIYAHSLLEQKRLAISKLNEMHMTQMENLTFAVTSTVIPV